MRDVSVWCLATVSYTHLDVYKRQLHGDDGSGALASIVVRIVLLPDYDVCDEIPCQESQRHSDPMVITSA